MARRSAKARQDADLADLWWRLTCLWSGEYSLGPELLGEVRSRGELVRLIEIPVPKPEAGIFDRLNSVQPSRMDLVRQAEATVAANYGHAIIAFLERLVSEREIHAQRATELIDRFLEKVGVGGDPWMRRFASKFAVVYAAAKIAAELNVAPWSSGHPFKCIERLYQSARALVITPEEALRGVLHQLARNAAHRFPKVGKGDRLPEQMKNKAWGIRHKTQDGISCLAVESSKLDRLVQPPQYAVRVRKLLAERGYTVPGKEGRHVRQIKVQGFGSTDKPYFMCIRLDRLPE